MLSRLDNRGALLVKSAEGLFTISVSMSIETGAFHAQKQKAARNPSAQGTASVSIEGGKGGWRIIKGRQVRGNLFRHASKTRWK